MDSVGRNANLPHLSRPAHASERPANGLSRVQLCDLDHTARASAASQSDFMIGYDGWTFLLLGNVW
jgi:hypothetical protein